MAEFLSREREFRKLNEQLDNEFKKTTLNKIEKIHEPTGTYKISLEDKVDEISMSQRNNVRTNDRFATYTKSKGHSPNGTKKICGVGGFSPPKSAPLKPGRELYSNGSNKNTNRTLNQGFDPFMSTKGSRKADHSRTGEESFRGTVTTVRLNQRKSKSPETPVVVHYHNEKFSSSTSLDNFTEEGLGRLDETNEEVEVAGDSTSLNDNKKGSRNETSHVLESKNDEGKNFKKFVNTTALVRFLKAKVSLLENNQVRSMQDMAEQKEAFEATTERLKSMQQQRDKAQSRCSTLSEQVEKLTAQLTEANRHSKELSQESSSQQKELDIVKRELKQLTLSYKNLETRHLRTKEELEAALKSQTSFKNSEKELKETMRRELESNNSEIKNLRKQRSDLFTAYKRQLYLIDNLRQQNICMEQAKMIDFSEKEFSKVLEWNVRS